MGLFESDKPKRRLGMLLTVGLATASVFSVSAITSSLPANAAVVCEQVSLLASTTSSEIRFYSVAGVLERTLPIAEPLKALTVTPDGQTIYGTSVSNPGALLTIDGTTGATLDRQPLTGAGGATVANAARHSLLIMTNGQIRFGASGSQTGLLINPATAVVTTNGSYPSGNGPVGGFTLLPDGDFLAGTRNPNTSTNHVVRFRTASATLSIANVPNSYWGFAQSGGAVYGIDDTGLLSLVSSPVRNVTSTANLPTVPIANLGAGITGLASPQDTGCTPFFTQTKTVDVRSYLPGQTITYDVTVSNTGQGLGTASLSDIAPNTVAVTNVTCAPTGAATCTSSHVGNNVTGETNAPPGQQAVFTITATVNSVGDLTNTATVTATTSGCTPVLCGGGNATSPTVSAVDPALSVTKTVTTNGGQPVGTVAVGQVLDYQYTVTNSGPVAVEEIAIEETFSGSGSLPPPTCSITSLAPAAETTCATSYSVTQADLDAGVLDNSAVATGSAIGSSVVVRSDPAVVNLTLPTVSELSLEKFAALESGGTGIAGDLVEYSFRLANTGTSTLTGVAVTDPLPGLGTISYDWPGATGILSPGEDMFATAQYTVQQSDVDTGTLTNEATASATAPGGGSVDSAPSTVTLDLLQSSSLSVTKTFDTAGFSTPPVPGNLINYQFSATNGGTVTLTSVSIVDTLTGVSDLVFTWPSTPGVLAPGETVTATATYPIDQTDINAGSVDNEALVEGTTPLGDTVAEQSPVVTTPITQTASVTISHTADTSGLASPPVAGNPVVYGFTLTNTGNTTLTAAAVVPSLPGLGALQYTWPGTTGTLNPGQSATATASYPVTQSDLDAATITGTAVVTAQDPGATTVTSPSTNLAVPLAQSGTLGLATTANTVLLAVPPVAGNVVTFSYTATNTGNTTLSAVSIGDALPGVGALSFTWPGAAGTLLPGEIVTATASYQLTQTDINAASVANSATASGTDPNSANVSAPPASISVPLARVGVLTVTNAVDQSALSVPPVPGDVLTYTSTVTNTGNVTLTGVVPANSLFAVPGGAVTWPGAVGVLSPGEAAQVLVSHQVTQAEIDAGQVVSVASASGVDPAASPVVSNNATQTVTLARSGALLLAMTANESALASPPSPGNIVTYDFTVTNTGNVTLMSAVIAPTLSGISALTYTWPGAPGVLAPGQVVTAIATAAITQGDIDAGQLDNQATATAQDSAPAGVTSNTVSTSTPLPPTPGLSLDRSVDETGLSVAPQAGEPLSYSYTITNDGNLTLTGISLTDTLPGLGSIVITWPGATGTLLPGQTATAVASYSITQANINTGSVVSSATASGTAPDSSAVDSPDVPLTVTLAQVNALTVSTTANTGSLASPPVAGNPITFDFVITNTGNTTLNGTTLTDSLAALNPISIAWPGVDGTLSPGAVATGTASTNLTLAELNAGVITSQATASGTGPAAAAVVSPTEIRSVPLARVGVLTVTNAVDQSALSVPPVPGDVLTYTSTVTNTGNVTLTGVVPANSLFAVPGGAVTWPGAVGVLSPGEAAQVLVSHQVTQAEIDAGQVVSVASASGVDPAASPVVSNNATQTVSLTRSGALLLAMTADESALANPPVPGNIVTYNFTLTNTGNTTVTTAVISPTLAGISVLTYTWPGAPGVLTPGQVATATATAAITQADIDAAQLNNQATATAQDPAATGVTSNTASTSSPITRSAALTISHTSNTSGLASPPVAGNPVAYGFTLTNTGNTTLTGAAVAPTLPGLGALQYTWPSTAGVLNPGQSATATASYPITQSDLNAATVTGTAVATAQDPGATTVTSPSTNLAVPLTQSATLAVTTTADTLLLAVPPVAGNVVTFSYTATNTGNTTLTAVSISDALPGVGPINYTWPGAVGVLLPGQSVTAFGSYQLTQGNINAASVANSATAAGTDPNSAAVTSAAASVSVPLARAGALSLGTSVDTAGLGTPSIAGNSLTYTFTMTNTGNTTLTSVVLVPVLVGLGTPSFTWPGTPGTLNPGEAATATASYAITQANLDAAQVVASATSSGQDPNSVTVSSPTSNSTTPLQQSNSITAGATPDTTALSNPPKVGNVVTYTFTATNAGNTTLSSVAVVNTLAGLGTATPAWPGAPGVLIPGQTVTWTANYALTQASIDAGIVANSTTTTARNPQSLVVTSVPAPSSVVINRVSVLTLAKQPIIRNGEIGNAGDDITYRFTIHNAGNTTLTGVTIADPLPGLGSITVDWPTIPGTLRPGTTAVGEAHYVVTQTDIENGGILNTATASANRPDGPPLSEQADAGIGVPFNPDLALTKTVDTSGLSNPPRPGDRLTYSFTLINTGNVILNTVTIDDPLPGLEPLNAAWPGSPGVLAPGATVTATAGYTVTTNDLNEGVIENVATATALSVSTFPAVAPAATATVTLAQQPSLDLQVSADTSSLPPFAQVGDIVSYTYTLTNTGNVTLENVGTTSSLAALNPIVLTWPGALGELMPNETATATVLYSVTQADLDAGVIRNDSSAAGATFSAIPVNAPDVSISTPLPQQSTLTIVKTGSFAPGDEGYVGDVLTYAFTFSNTGNTTLSSLSIADPLPGLSSISVTWPGVSGTLSPGQNASGSATYAITRADFEAGRVVNTATASGSEPGGSQIVTPPSTWTQPLVQLSELSLTTSIDAASLGDPPQAGQLITLTYTIVNTGNLPLTGVALADALPGITVMNSSWPGSEGALLPGQTATLTGELTLTQTLIDAGVVTSVAYVTGVDPSSGAVASPTVTTDLQVKRAPALGLALEGNSTATEVGDPAEFTVTLTNTGNTSLTVTSLVLDLSGTQVSLISVPSASPAAMAQPMTQPMAQPALLPVAQPVAFNAAVAGPLLSPGADLVVPYRYLVTQADFDRGAIVATASADANASGIQAQVLAESTLKITLPALAAPPGGALSRTGAERLVVWPAALMLLTGLILISARRRKTHR